ncbi:hypothetical protein HBI56_040430 [Parastagonospora nodorum]|uniref:Uncharacterized protein n=1 Tax=Phaeosphaeria nodorum (strain SN15 / ATCC MYA-4574 / FGSC 10173) TaxID=321614 RepID=A0A7U2EWR9_PHANO|nr:hypothetical protein HBH56_066340 [Parastagonospora nodorum]QRC93333.1 hypothetical protein JI435_403630 [Parastagonospora nodorum SN15]KAH3932671.1 hypothetical protein HBH54_081750 [Parastagonospora nodorum]KAH3954869.1 hypothetical protein HBH53_012630 [Parastagonospora nodorum]KAH3986290.1 hypothetical protein HBH52_043830 [Parastagonospora nodorum]
MQIPLKLPRAVCLTYDAIEDPRRSACLKDMHRQLTRADLISTVDTIIETWSDTHVYAFAILLMQPLRETPPRPIISRHGGAPIC